MKFNVIKSGTTAGGHKGLFGLLKEQNDGTGRHIFLVPDRYTLGVEKEICEVLYPDGAFNVDVCSFTRLAQKALGKKNKICLSKEGTVLLLNRIICENSDKLTFYRNVKSVAFSREMFASIAAIRTSGITSERFIETVKDIEGNVGDKLRDIGLLYKLYEEEIKGRYFDTVTRVDWLINNLADAPIARDSHIYVLGFNVYSNAQLEFIRRAILLCPSVSVAYCDGKGNDNAACFPTAQVKGLMDYCFDAGIPVRLIEENLPLDEQREFLHGSMFGVKNNVYNGKNDNKVRVHGEPNAYEEVKKVAREIRFLVFERGYRYKETAVVVNNPDYNGLIRKTFDRFDIPYFIDEKYEVKNGFFAKFVRLLLACVEDLYEFGRVMQVIRHPYSGFCRSEIQDFENYCIKYNVNYSLFSREFVLGGNDETEKELLTSAESVRKRVVQTLSTVPKNGKARDFCEYILSLAADEYINLKESEYSVGRSIEERVYSDKEKFLGVVSEISEQCGETEMTVGEFNDTLSSVIENMTVSVLPQYMDAVFVGNTSESRFGGVKAMFVIGASDGFFPVTTGDKLILGCYDTLVMKQNGLEVFPSPEESNYFEQFAVIDLVTKPDRLYVTYPTAYGDGSTASPGSAVREIKYRLSLKEKDFIDYHELTDEKKLAYVLATFANARFEYLSGGVPSEYAQSVRKMLEEKGLISPEEENAPKADLLRGYARDGSGRYKLSVSKMEAYFKCPFKNYLKNVLGLREKIEGGLKVNDKGTIIHAVLEKYFSKGRFLREATEEERVVFAEECIKTVLYSEENKRFFENATSRKELESIQKECFACLKALTDNMLNSEFTPEFVEKRFDGGDGLEFEIDGKKFVFVGFVDRVDVADDRIIIIDYKTGRADDSLKTVYTGEKIQLYVYLRYFTGKGYKPAGVFYLPISDGYSSKPSSYAMKGQALYSETLFEELDKRIKVAPNGKYGSPNVSIPLIVKDGHATFDEKRATNLLTERQFTEVTDYVGRLCVKAIEEIAEGYAERKPTDGACEYCPYKKICGDVEPREKVCVDKLSFDLSANEDGGKDDEVE